MKGQWGGVGMNPELPPKPLKFFHMFRNISSNYNAFQE